MPYGGYNGSQAAEQSFSRGNEYMMQGAQFQAQGITSAANSVAQGIRDFQQMSQQKQEFQLRAQAAQMEMDLNRQKLADMQAVDMVTRSRLENEALKAQVDAAKQQMRQANDDHEYNKSLRGEQQQDRAMQRDEFQRKSFRERLANGEMFINERGMFERSTNAEQRRRGIQQAIETDPNLQLKESEIDLTRQRISQESQLSRDKMAMMQIEKDMQERKMAHEQIMYAEKTKYETQKYGLQLQILKDRQSAKKEEFDTLQKMKDSSLKTLQETNEAKLKFVRDSHAERQKTLQLELEARNLAAKNEAEVAKNKSDIEMERNKLKLQQDKEEKELQIDFLKQRSEIQLKHLQDMEKSKDKNIGFTFSSMNTFRQDYVNERDSLEKIINRYDSSDSQMKKMYDSAGQAPTPAQRERLRIVNERLKNIEDYQSKIITGEGSDLDEILKGLEGGDGK